MCAKLDEVPKHQALAETLLTLFYPVFSFKSSLLQVTVMTKVSTKRALLSVGLKGSINTKTTTSTA